MAISNCRIVDPYIGLNGAPISQTASAPQAPLGYEAKYLDYGARTDGIGAGLGGVVRYCQGSDVGTAGLVVYISNNSAVKLAAAQNAMVGIAAAPLSATNVYGWVAVQGQIDWARGTNVALTSGNPVYVGTAGGFVVSGSVAGSQIRNMSCWANYTSSQSLSMSMALDRPWVYSTGASI